MIPHQHQMSVYVYMNACFNKSIMGKLTLSLPPCNQASAKAGRIRPCAQSCRDPFLLPKDLRISPCWVCIRWLIYYLVQTLLDLGPFNEWMICEFHIPHLFKLSIHARIVGLTTCRNLVSEGWSTSHQNVNCLFSTMKLHVNWALFSTSYTTYWCDSTTLPATPIGNVL